MNKRAFSKKLTILTIGLAASVVMAALIGAAYFHWRTHKFDGIIEKAGLEYDVSPELIRVVIQRESSFNHRSVGKAGEIGLMQVMPAAASEWAEAAGIKNFNQHELFRPEVNIRAGTWYLGRALRYWQAKPNPLPYALAEYNAGRSNAIRWAAKDRDDPNIFWQNITYPGTKQYIRTILNEYRRHTANQ